MNADVRRVLGTLRAIHRPAEEEYASGRVATVCAHCNVDPMAAVLYPCPTLVAASAAALRLPVYVHLHGGPRPTHPQGQWYVPFPAERRAAEAWARVLA